MSDPTAAPPRRRRVRLFLALAAVPLALVAAELLVRGWYAVSGAPYSAEGARERILLAVSAMNDPIPGTRSEPRGPGIEKHVIHPFYGFEVPNALVAVRAQAEAFARTEERARKFIVIFVGGSVAGRQGRLGAERLQALLAADPRLADRQVEVLNHGRGSFKQPQQLMLVGYLFALGIVPDVLVNVDGFNEVALGAHNAAMGIHPLYPHWTRWAHLVEPTGLDDGLDYAMYIREFQREGRELAERALARGYERSAVLGRWTLSRIGALQTRWSDAQARYAQWLAQRTSTHPARGPAFPRSLAAALETIVRAWSESSISLDAQCRARSVLYLHVLQPTLHDEGSKPLTEEELSHGKALDAQVEGVRAGYPMLRAAGAELAARGVAFLDASRLFAEIDESLYFDACHFRERGIELLTDAIAAAILERLPPADARTSR